MYVEKYHKIILENGICIYFVPLKETRSVYMGFGCKVGGRNETDDKIGIAHFLEHLMIVNGTTTRPNRKLENELNVNGIEFNAETTYEYTMFYLSCNMDDVKKCSDLLLDIYINNQITQ